MLGREENVVDRNLDTFHFDLDLLWLRWFSRHRARRL